MNLIKYYKQAIIPPSIIVFTLITIYITYDNFFCEKYESEWLDAKSFYILEYFMGLIFTISISVLSLTIFFNKIEEVRRNKFSNFLSWFLLPSIWFIYIFAKHIRLIIHTEQYYWKETLFLSMVTIPFMIALIISFIKFKKEQKRNILLN